MPRVQLRRAPIALTVLIAVARATPSAAADPAPTASGARASADATPAARATSAEASGIPAARAAEHVGENVAIVGRVVAIHSSPTATVLAFAPNFAGFTATILAADRDKFPQAFEDRYQDKAVRLTGAVTAYRGKPEMRLQDPTQIALVDAAAESASPVVRVLGPAAARTSPTPDALAEVRQNLAALNDRLDTIDARLGGIEARLGGLERNVAVLAATPPEARAPLLAIGVPSATVRAAYGDPVEIGRGARGETIWLYGTGRSVTFDGDGRVLAWTGF
jgi:hypothetical protein